MLKKQLITIGAVLCILASGGCITMAAIDTYKDHHPPAPTTSSFEALRQMKVLKIEVVDETKEKHVDTAELANALVRALNKELAISSHSHVQARIDDQVAADGKLIVRLMSVEPNYNATGYMQYFNYVPWSIHYEVQFYSSNGNLLNEYSNKFRYLQSVKEKKKEKIDPEHLRPNNLQKDYETDLSRQIIDKTFVF